MENYTVKIPKCYNSKFKTDPKRWRQYVSYFGLDTVGGIFNLG